MTRMRLSNMRAEAVSCEFEGHVEACVEIPELGYSRAAIELGMHYFTDNGAGRAG
jgi:hypothetical protein